MMTRRSYSRPSCRKHRAAGANDKSRRNGTIYLCQETKDVRILHETPYLSLKTTRYHHIYATQPQQLLGDETHRKRAH